MADPRLWIDGKDFTGSFSSMELIDPHGKTLFRWKRTRWNTGVEGMAGAFDVVHRLPKGLRKSKPRKSNCPNCGAPWSLRVQHYATAYVYGGGYCESWAQINKRWALIGRTEW